MSDSNAVEANKRRCRRRPPKGRAKVICQRGALHLGPNLTIAVLDLSETGVRLTVKELVNGGQEVSLELEAPASARAVKLLGTVVWSGASADGGYCVGIRFQKQLAYRDFLNFV